MAGKDTPYRCSFGMNGLDTVGLISHIFGLWQGRDGGEAVEAVDEECHLHTLLCFEGERLVRAISIGQTRAM